jgi:hypothetical protein
MNSEILLKYQSLANRFRSLAGSEKKRLKLISFARLICFLSIIPVWYYLSPVNSILAISLSLLFLASFLFLIKLFIKTEKQLHFYQQLAEINQDEISAANRNFSSFDAGNEFTDPHHDYSFDLDIYGTGSIFQFLNRTATVRGKKFLSSLLNQSQRTSDEITEKQEAIQELGNDLDWRQHFLAKGQETKEQTNHSQLDDPIHHLITLKSAKLLNNLLIGLPAVTLILIGLSLAGIVSESYYLLAIFSQWILFLLYSKTISRFQKQFERQSGLLNHYAELLRQIENMPFKSVYLTALKEKLSAHGKTASHITSELKKTLNEFDYRQNLIVALVLNSVLLWDIRCISKMYRWQQNYASDLPRWFRVIAEMDALVSLANCNFNHPEWTTPEVRSAGFLFKAEGLGHPLIDEIRCVRNSFQLTNDEQIAIVTGANMAGKSTFLRTVGVNLILASNGCKVCAEGFEFSPVRIFTNMRTSDNLMNDESYFYAELLRLQTMLNLLRKGENLFVIIDEMLKGTNSVDKLNGSKELLRQLIALKTHGIVATHDLNLTELSQIYPFSIKNQCFEVQLHHDELAFDYKLTDGVTRTMNATFLMKKMGIIPN